jgi:uncharacterized protein involved in exopolysaccharide biosynthesis
MESSAPAGTAPRYAKAHRPADPDEVSVLSLMNVVLRRRGLVVGTAFVCFATLLLLTLLQARTYRSSSALLPKSRGTVSNLAGLAAQLGITVPISEGTESPDFYVELLDTRNILGQAVATTYEFPSDSGRTRGTLAAFYKVEGKTAALRQERAIDRLRDDIKADVRKTGVVSVAVTTRDAALSEQVNRRLVELLQQFNLETRQTQAGAERRFTEQRLDEVRRDLRESEDRLQGFLLRNRDFRNSPVLVFEQERLTRELSRQQELYNSLSQAYESAKIEEVRDTPVLTIVEPPDLPARPVPRGVVKKSAMALAVGLLLGVLLAFTRDLMSRSGQEAGDEFAEFTALRRAALDDLLHPWRPLRRFASRRRSSALSPLPDTRARRQAGGP